MGAFDKDIA